MKRSIYIFNDGALQRKGNTVYFDTGNGGKYVPIENLKELFIFGEISVTKKLLELLAQQEVIVHFFNYYGYYTGSFYPREHLNSGYMILKQASFNFRRFSLNLDISEIFKPILVDRLILSLVGKGVITKKDFEKKLGGIILNEKGKQKFIQAMEERLKTTIHHRKVGKTVSYRTLIRMELYKLEKHFMGEEEYEPFLAQW